MKYFTLESKKQEVRFMQIDRALTDPEFFADHDPHQLWQ
jgi:hypothetical protein